MNDYFTSAYWLFAANKLLRIAGILIGSMVVLRFFGPVIDRFFVIQTGNKKYHMEEKRARTLSALLKSIIRYSVYFMVTVMVLQEFSIDTTSIIAGAGIVGLAIGVGAQSLVKDIITGFFIILEDQYAVGDYIATADMTGFVEEIGFRVTTLRDINGVRHIIPNGAIAKVSNYTRGYMQAVINLPVAYTADLDKVLGILEEICESMKDLPVLLEKPKVLGAVDFRTADILVKIVAKTAPLEQLGVETALRRRIKERFDEEEIPPPSVIYSTLPVREGKA